MAVQTPLQQSVNTTQSVNANQQSVNANQQRQNKSPLELMLLQIAMANNTDWRTLLGAATGKLLRNVFDEWKGNYDARGYIKDYIAKASPEQREAALQRLEQNNPSMHQNVLRYIGKMGIDTGSSPQIDISTSPQSNTDTTPQLPQKSSPGLFDEYLAKDKPWDKWKADTPTQIAQNYAQKLFGENPFSKSYSEEVYVDTPFSKAFQKLSKSWEDENNLDKWPNVQLPQQSKPRLFDELLAEDAPWDKWATVRW